MRNKQQFQLAKQWYSYVCDPTKEDVWQFLFPNHTSRPDLRTLLESLAGHGSTVNSVAFSPDGKYLASGSEDKTIKLWHLRPIINSQWLNYYRQDPFNPHAIA